MLAKVWSCAIVSLDTIPIEVEVDLASQELPCFMRKRVPSKRGSESNTSPTYSRSATI